MRINPGRAEDSVGRPPEEVLVLLGFVKPLSGRDCVPMLRDAFACGVLVLARSRIDARPERAYFPVRARFGNSREGEHKIVLKYLFVGVSGFMWQQIRVVQGFMFAVSPEKCSLH